MSEEPKSDAGAGTSLPEPPDGAGVNAAWRAEAAAPRGLKGVVYRLLERLLSPRFAAQREWNAEQVRLDNALLRYLGARFSATHENYDRILGLLGRRLDEIDERHRGLEAEVQVQMRDLVRRIDLVLEESTRGRLARDGAFEDLRARLVRLEKALRRPAG